MCPAVAEPRGKGRGGGVGEREGEPGEIAQSRTLLSRTIARAYVSSGQSSFITIAEGKREEGEGRHPELPSRTLVSSARPSATPSYSGERWWGVLPEKWLIIEECIRKRRTEIFARVYVYARVRMCTSARTRGPANSPSTPVYSSGTPTWCWWIPSTWSSNSTHTDTAHTRARPPRSGLREWRQAVPDGGGRVSKAGRSATDTHTYALVERTVGRTRACVPEARERRPRACSPPLPLARAHILTHTGISGARPPYTARILASSCLSPFPSTPRYTPPSGWSTTPCISRRHTDTGRRATAAVPGAERAGSTGRRRSVRRLADDSGERGETGWIRGGRAIQGTRFQHRQTAVPRSARGRGVVALPPSPIDAVVGVEGTTPGR